MATQQSLNTQERFLATQARKIPREARPEIYATKALERFLLENREGMSSLEGQSIQMKRHSAASSKHSRPKEFFKNMLRSDSTPAILHLADSGDLQHKCMVLRQIVPETGTRYNRIVSESSQYESLEAMSTFQVNCQFQGANSESHDDPTALDRDNTAVRPLSHYPASLKGGRQFRIRSSFMSGKSLGSKVSRKDKVAIHNTMQQRGRSLQRALDTQQDRERRLITLDSDLSGQSASPQKSEVQQESYQDRIKDAPQIQPFPPDAAAFSAFPASDIMRRWGKRQSYKSTLSSPSKAQGYTVPTKRRQEDIEENIKSLRVLASPKGHKYKHSVPNSGRRTPHQQPNDARQRKLASPVKLGRPQGPSDLRISINSCDRNAPLASNPSHPAAIVLSRLGEIQQTTSDQTEVSQKPLDPDIELSQPQFKTSETLVSTSVGSSESPLKCAMTVQHNRTMSIERSPPSTPAPTTPLPPIPVQNSSRRRGIESPTRKAGAATRTDNDLEMEEKKRSPGFPAIQDLRLGGEPQQDLSMQYPLGDEELKHIQAVDRTMVQLDTTDANRNTSERIQTTSMHEPQPSLSRQDSRDRQIKHQSISSIHSSASDPFLQRKQKTDSLKRLHLRKARREGEMTEINQSSPVASRTVSDSIIELPSVRSSQPEYLDIVFGQSAGNSDYGESVVSQRLSQPGSRLSFTGPKLAAEIKPLDIAHIQNHRTLAGRTIYRSHSTQMSPDKDMDVADPTDKAVTGDSADTARDVQDTSSQGSEQERASTVATEYEFGIADDADDILEAIDRLMGDMEDRLEAKISAELERRFSTIQRRLNLLEVVVIGKHEKEKKEKEKREKVRDQAERALI